MNKKLWLLLPVSFTCFVFGQSSVQTVPADYTQYVDPMIGTAPATIGSEIKLGGTEDNALVQPSVTFPFAMTNWSPQTTNTENKCVASYFYQDSLITGFRGSHWLSGSCVQEYGSMTIMPESGQLICNPLKRGSRFSRSLEHSTPQHYKVDLNSYQIIAEMTATMRCGIFRFTFNKAGKAHLVVNPNNDKGEGYVEVIPQENEIVGYNPVRRIYQGVGKSAGFSGYFVMKMEKTPDSFGVYTGDQILKGQLQLINRPDLGAYFTFSVKKGELLKVKIGTSFVSIEEARKNLQAEIPDFDFRKTEQKLKNKWNEILSRIVVESSNRDELVKFYTAMYHSYQQPRTFNDLDGCYPQFDGNDRTDTICNGNYYSDFSAWDTFRALHPLYNLIAPRYNADMVKSLLALGRVRGWMPIFPQWNSYTSAMIGDHVVAIIAEAYIKGVINLTEADYQLMRRNATESPATFAEYVDGKGRRALKSYLKYGYIPLEDSVKEAFHTREQVSRTLEYAYDDFALAQTAKKMGKSDDYLYFMKRAQNYRNVFDPKVNNMNGRYANGDFYKDFDRKKMLSFFTEGTPWQYNWFVPQDPEGLIQLMGGRKIFNQTLDDFFAEGQYWHGNEPGQQIPFLYIYSGEPWKSTMEVRHLLKTEYSTGPGGLSGNDDSGQMSAWYILGAIGFYPVCPVLPEYAVTGPIFTKVTIKLENGKTLVITALNTSEKNCYIQSARLNNKPFNQCRITQDEIINGGKLVFEMGPEPNMKWGVEPETKQAN